MVMKQKKLILVVVALAVSPFSAIASSTSLETSASFSRLVIPVNAKSRFSVKEESGQVVLKLEDNPRPAEVKVTSDQRIKKINLLHSGSTTQEIGLMLEDSSLDYFAYYQPSPPSIVIDIWPKKAEAKSAEIGSRVPAEVKKPIAKPAVAKKINEKPLSLKDNFFFQIPIIVPNFVYSGDSFDTSKERNISGGWNWTKPDNNIPGATNFSLAQKLFERKQYALCIKTIEFARRDYPAGKYSDEMDFLEALAYREMGLAEKDQFLTTKSEEKLQELMLRESREGGYLPFSSKIRIFFASEAYRNERWLDAVSHFEFITTGKNAEKEQDYTGIVMAMAEAYFQLRQYRRVERIYRSLDGKEATKSMIPEAAYRLGNIHAHEKALKKADKAFRDALRKYPEHEAIRVEAYFNLAEVNFGMGDFKKSEEYFLKFLELHPSNTLAGLALVRMGEISELLRKDTNKASEYYLSAINRFPFSLADTLGRLRRARLNVKTEKDIDFQIGSISDVIKSEPIPEEVKRIAHETLIGYLMQSERFEEAAKSSEEGMSITSGVGYEIMKRLYVDALRMQVQQLNKKMAYDQLLALYKQKTEWLEKIGPELYKELAEAYRGLGIYETSNQFLARYAEETRNSVHGRNPSSLERAQDQIALNRAKGEYLQGRFGSLLETLDGFDDIASLRLKVKALLKLNRNNEAKAMSEILFQKVLSTKSSNKKARDEAIIDATEARIVLANERKDYADLESGLQRAIAQLSSRNERFEVMLGDALWFQEKHRPAISAYRKSLEFAKSDERIARANYRMAMSQIAVGEKMEAVNILTKIRSGSQNIWSESARRELELIEWEKKYSVIIGDLPPMGLGIKN